METEIAREEIASKVRRTIADALQIDVDDVTFDASLDEPRLGIDSLRLIKLNVALEEAFDVALPDFTEGTEVRSVGDVVDLVARRLQGDAR